jgi:general stress protein 26
MPFAAWCLSLALLLLPQTTPAAPPTRDAIIKASRTIITNARYATFVTVAGVGAPNARVVDPFAPEADLTIWFATNPSSRKVQELAKDPHVTLLYFDAANKGYVTVRGTATLVRDPQEKSTRWKEDWAGMYKDKNRGDDYLLVKVVPDTLEVVSVALGMINDAATWRPVTLKLR